MLEKNRKMPKERKMSTSDPNEQVRSEAPEEVEEEQNLEYNKTFTIRVFLFLCVQKVKNAKFGFFC